jgi:hypothetical protein
MATLTFSEAALAEVRGRSHGMCQLDLCGLGHHAHHRRVKGMGGSDDPDTNLASNGLWLAHGCHARIHSRVTEAAVLGLLVDQGVRPVGQPAYLTLPYGRRWYWLRETGVEVCDWPRPDVEALARFPLPHRR